MVQAMIAYALVAVAAAWVAWSMFAPRALKMRFKKWGGRGRR